MKKDILVINKNSNIAVCTLWSKKEKILEKLSKEIKQKICIIGTLYTSFGVNYLIQTLGEFNNINILIIFGNDLSDSGEFLIDVFSNKKLEKLIIPKNKAEKIVKSVILIDLRKEAKNNDFKTLEKIILSNFNPNLPKREKIKIEIKEVKASSWPFEIVGQKIYETSVFRAWIKILKLIKEFGFLKQTEYGELQKEVLNLLVVVRINNGKYEIEKEFEKYFSKKIIEKHVNEVLTPKKPKNVEYTYGERFFSHKIGKNQIEYLIKKLAKKPYSRRAIAISWDHQKDFTSEQPPCIIIIQGTISNNFYHHFVFIRSNDMARAWPINFIAQIKLAEYIVKKINEIANTSFKIGTVSSLSFSAHIYEHDFEFIDKVVKENKKLLQAFIPDQCGNFIFLQENGKIKVELRTPDNIGLVKKWDFLDLKKAYYELKEIALFLDPLHSFYLGKEITFAIEKIKRKEKYLQDMF